MEDFSREGVYLQLETTLEEHRQSLMLAFEQRKQETLFLESEQSSLDQLLSGLLDLVKQRKPLYQRWRQADAKGKVRELSVPNKILKALCTSYILGLLELKPVHERCHGGEKGWSVKKSLESHMPCCAALSFDLEKAFENVPYLLIARLFSDLLPAGLGCEREKLAEFFALLCTITYSSDKRGLPQGSPVSLAIFNRLWFPYDARLADSARQRTMKYSRWVDDLTITSTNSLGIEHFLGAVDFVNQVFPVSKGKVFFQDKSTIYLLGHKLAGSDVLKNSEEEKSKNKAPLDFEAYFGAESSRNYDLWS